MNVLQKITRGHEKLAGTVPGEKHIGGVGISVDLDLVILALGDHTVVDHRARSSSLYLSFDLTAVVRVESAGKGMNREE